MKRIALFVLLLLASTHVLYAQDRITRSGAKVQVNADGSVTVVTAAGKSFRLTPVSSLPPSCVDGHFNFLAHVGLKQCVDGVWGNPGGEGGGVAGVTTFNTRDGDVTLSSGDVAAALGFTPENTANKNAANGYAGLTGGKISGAQMSDVLGLDELDDVVITTPAGGQFVRYTGTNWVNAAILAGDLPSGIDAAKIGGGGVSSAEFDFISGLTSDAQVQINGKQPIDSDLTDFAALTPANNDIPQRKAGQWVNRTLEQLKADLAYTTADLPDFNTAVDARINYPVTSFNSRVGAILLSSVDVTDALTYTPVPPTRAVNGHPLSSDVTVTKGDVGLGNADNTSDASKPISTATQAALDLKAATSHVHAGADITSGTVADARLSTNVTLLGNSTTGTGAIVRAAAPTFSGTVTSGGDINIGSNRLQLTQGFIKAGTTNVTTIRNNADTGYGRLRAGVFFVSRDDDTLGVDMGLSAVDQIRIGSGGSYSISSTVNSNGGSDIGWCRRAAGRAAWNDGSATCTNLRDVEARQYFVEATVTAAGTTGNQTINKAAGTVNIAAGNSSVVITSDKVTANSIINVISRTNDATCAVKNYVPSAGSFTVNMTASCTAETSIGFHIINQ